MSAMGRKTLLKCGKTVERRALTESVACDDTADVAVQVTWGRDF